MIIYQIDNQNFIVTDKFVYLLMKPMSHFDFLDLLTYILILVLYTRKYYAKYPKEFFLCLILKKYNLIRSF